MSPFFQRDPELDENGNPVGPPPMPSLGRPPMRRFSPDSPPPQPPEQAPPPPPMAQQGPPQLMASAPMPSPPPTPSIVPPRPQIQVQEDQPDPSRSGPMSPPTPPKPYSVQEDQAGPPQRTPFGQDPRQLHAKEAGEQIWKKSQEKAPLWRTALGAALSVSPRLKGVGQAIMHPPDKLEEQYPNILAGGKQAEQEQEAEARAAHWQEATAATKDARLAATAQRAEGDRLRAKPSPQSSAERWNEVKDDETLTDLQKAYYRYTGKLPPSGTAGGRELASNIMTREQMQEAEALGMKFPDLNGDLWHSADLPQGTGIHRRADGSYEPNALPQHTVTTDNRTNVVNKFNQHLLAGPSANPEQPNYVGDARTGSSGQHEVAGVDAQGNPTTSTYTSSRRPYSGPIRGMVPPISNAPTQTGSQAGVGAPGVQPQLQSPQQRQPQGPGNNRRITFTPANREAQLANIRPLKETAAQLFPDKGVGLVDFADLANDAGSRQRVGKFLRMVMAEQDKEGAGGHAGVGVSAGPVNLSAGSFGEWLQRRLHVPGGIAESQVQQMEDALKSMSPRERDYANSFITSKSAISGMRKATGGLATNAAISALEKDLPYISMNVLNREDYIKKMANVARIIGTGLQGYSAELTDIGSPGTHQRLQGLHDELMKQLGGAGQQPPQGGGNPNPSGYVVGQRYGGLTYLGGDPNQQRSWKR